MCGIVGAVARRNTVPILIDGLKRLEYRGYDSAGIAVINGHLQCLKSVGHVQNLADKVGRAGAHGEIGIGHTRWATHGDASERNAHPHVSLNGVAVVHNGIIENHEDLRKSLETQGYEFKSDTDTEVIAQLLDSEMIRTGSLGKAMEVIRTHLKGSYAIAAVHEKDPTRLYAARMGSPLLVGVGKGEYFLASDVSALIGETRSVLTLEDGDIAELSVSGCRVWDHLGPVSRTETQSLAEISHSGLGVFEHYMQKEIVEQPEAAARTVEKILDMGFTPEIFGRQAKEVFEHLDSVTFLACGTSYHAAVTARYWIEQIARVPCQVEIASEYRYRNPIPNPKSLVITVSQSGETADTLAALRHAKTIGHKHSLAICNVAESALVRESEMSFLTQAGVEIGVASTKAFTTQLAALFAFAVTLGRARKVVSDHDATQHLTALAHLENDLFHVMNLEPKIIKWAHTLSKKKNALFLGRGIFHPIAMEGALKLKEISYIHAEAYPAGELKHGPLALVDEEMPVVALAPNDAYLDKLKSNLQEVRARGGEIFVVADTNAFIQEEDRIHVIRVPRHEGILGPILHVVPLQMLAYHVSRQLGTNIDRPRNLAKAVSVE